MGLLFVVVVVVVAAASVLCFLLVHHVATSLMNGNFQCLFISLYVVEGRVDGDRRVIICPTRKFVIETVLFRNYDVESAFVEVCAHPAWRFEV